MTLHSLYSTRGEWNFYQTPKIVMQGINSQSVCDMMFEAKFVPGPHITHEYKTQLKIPDNFGVNMQFHVQKGIEVFKCYKRELPGDIRSELLANGFCMADPHQVEEGEDMLLIHGIIGEDSISGMDESIITKIGTVGMKTTRSLYGDLLHGKSHYIKFPYKKGYVDLKDEQDFIAHTICQYGITPVLVHGQDEKVAESYEYLKSLCE
jgi:hypothetical protein